jgi:hypothetical protein
VQEEYIDPVILKPDLYAAAVANDEEEVKALLQQNVPGTFIDTANGWTVSITLTPSTHTHTHTHNALSVLSLNSDI